MSADPVSLPITKIGEYAVCAAVNALSAEMILPQSFRPVVLLPPGTEEADLRRIMDQIGRTCASLQLSIEGGHTEVTPAVTRPVVIGCCTGVPMDRCKCADAPMDVADCNGGAEHPGDAGLLAGSKEPDHPADSAAHIVMTKWAGMEGTCLLAQEKEELRDRFPETLLSRMRMLDTLLCVRDEAIICAREGAAYLTDLSDGGFYAALHRLSKKAKRGFRVDLSSVPILQETIEFSNHYDIDPYTMRSMGSLLVVTRDAETLIARLGESGIPAVRIGELSRDRDKILLLGEEKRFLDLPQPDALLKVL